MKQSPEKYIRIFASLSIIGCIFLFIMPGNAYADLNGITLKGAFNDKELNKSDSHTDDPIEGVTLKIDEPFTLDFYVTPVKDGNIGIELTEPGSKTLVSYYRISGDEIGHTEKNCTAGVPVHFHWVLAPNDKWANGNCPISVFYGVWQRENKKTISGVWGFVNPHISSDHYTGAKPTSTSSSTSNSTGATSTPGFSFVPAITAFILALVVLGLYKRK